ncbi:GIY-YIG nuclease family protein [Salinibacterium sp. SYSU T00001]|uniref:GIY-YIG nuclease family protein n=1 Tax=Homoserinimonas sedimenticola TaxID=2986805 RepID=UPI0022365CE7|nr:GIY-YIG nuclease family protein [Salinibacterium sedimenticola]MCW4386323.1 GIY-YIG nuclease family protein [Salinibacterium sedimenticola]
MSQGKQVLLYLVDGRPGGLRTAEIANWTGHVLAGERSDLSRIIARDESKRTGVYLLLGDQSAGATQGRPRVYVGESDDVASRLRQHHDKKDWWDRVVVVTSQAQAQQLTKSQVRFLESELIARAKLTGRADVENGTDPGFARLSEAELSNMSYFLEQLHVLLPTIGVDVFRRGATSPTEAPAGEPPAQDESPVFIVRGRKRGIEARARFVDGEFIVLAGSMGASAISESAKYSESTARAYANYRAIHSSLVEQGMLVVERDIARFVKDVPFSSPSTAGAIVLGRSCNGRTSWTTETGLSFGAWEGRDIISVGVEE